MGLYRGLYWGYIGIMEKKMQMRLRVKGLGFGVKGLGFRDLSSRPPTPNTRHQASDTNP